MSELFSILLLMSSSLSTGAVLSAAGLSGGGVGRLSLLREHQNEQAATRALLWANIMSSSDHHDHLVFTLAQVQVFKLI